MPTLLELYGDQSDLPQAPEAPSVEAPAVTPPPMQILSAPGAPRATTSPRLSYPPPPKAVTPEPSRQPTLLEMYGDPSADAPATAQPQPPMARQTSPTLLELYGDPSADTPVTRQPPEQSKPWGWMDNMEVAGAGLELMVAGELAPLASNLITSPVEAAPRPNMFAHTLGIPESVGNFIQAAPSFVGQVGGAALGAVFGGPAGAGAVAGADTLARNAEQRRIGMERERDAIDAAAGNMSKFPESRTSEFVESVQQTDGGDVLEAGINAALTPLAMKFGQGMDMKAMAAIATGARPLVAQGMNVLKQAGFDAATAIPAAVSARANAMDMTAGDWLNPEKLGEVLNPIELLKEASTQVAFSVGGQAVGTYKAMTGETGMGRPSEWNEPVVTPDSVRKSVEHDALIEQSGQDVVQSAQDMGEPQIAETLRRVIAGEDVPAEGRAMADSLGLTEPDAPVRADGMQPVDVPADIAPSRLPADTDAPDAPDMPGDAITGDAGTTMIDPKQTPVVEMPLSEISLSKDVPNFKEGADASTGVVAGEELQGGYERLGTAPIIVWERSDGRREVITGRHRLDLARRSGEQTIPTQVVREADGFSKSHALTLDAESNIRDEKGTEKDFAQFFKNGNLDESEARQRGLLSRAKGNSGWDIANNASPNLYSTFINDSIDAGRAAAIARAVPGDARAQDFALDHYQKNTKASASKLADMAGFIQYTRGRGDASGAVQDDLLGGVDTSGGEVFASLHKAADGERRRVNGLLKIVGPVSAKIEDARAVGIKVKNEADLKRQRKELQERAEKLKYWASDPDMMAEISSMAGVKQVPSRYEARATQDVPDDNPLADTATESMFGDDGIAETQAGYGGQSGPTAAAIATAPRTDPDKQPGPYGDAEANPVWGGVKRPAGVANTASTDSAKTTDATPAVTTAIEGYGNEARNADGELPRRMNGVNLRTLTEGDEQKKNFVAGAMLLDEDQIDLKRQVDEGIFESAAKVKRWDNMDNVRAVKANGSYSAAEGVALADRTAAALAAARENPTPENLRRFQDLSAAHGRVGSAQGLALGARNIMAEAMENQMTPLEQAVFNTQKMWNSKDNADIPDDILKQLLALPDPNDRNAITRVLKAAAKKHAGKLGQFDAYRYANMLSSPMTQTLNIVSNATKMFLAPVVHSGARGLDMVARGDRQLATGETRAALAGMRAGMFDAGRNAYKALRDGYTFGDMDTLDPRGMKVEIGGVFKPLNAPSRALHAADEFFKTMAESSARSMNAHRKAWFNGREKGLKGEALDKFIQETTPLYYNDRGVQKAAKDYAQRAVWQEAAPLSLQKFNNLPEPYKTILNTTMRVLVPFTRVIGNVTKEGLIYSGGGFLSPTATKHMTREAKAEAFSKAMIGVSSGIALTSYAMAGNITQDVPKDPEERELFYESGKRPFSINVGGRWFDYRMLGPLAWPIMGAASYAEDVKKNPTASEMSHLVQAAFGVVSTTTQLPVLSGLGGFLDILSEPNEKKINAFFANLSSQITPMSSGQRFLNNTGIFGEEVRESNTLGERIQSGTLLDQGGLGLDPLLPKKNSLGQTVTRTGYVPEVDSGDPLFMEMDRLGLKPPSMPSRMKVERKGKTRALRPEEKRTILEAGSPAYEELMAYIEKPKYKKLTEERKAYWLDKNIKNKIEDFRNHGVREVKRTANASDQ